MDESKGDNNGSKGEKSYFNCEDGKGLFLRATQVKVIADDGGPTGLKEEAKEVKQEIVSPKKLGIAAPKKVEKDSVKEVENLLEEDTTTS